MIGTMEVAAIIYRKCAELEVPVSRYGFLPKGPEVQERVVVAAVKAPSAETFWTKCFVEVNYLVPDLEDGVADLRRLTEVERRIAKLFDGYGVHDGTPYRYQTQSTEILEGKDYKSHYVNCRILFKQLNTIEK